MVWRRVYGGEINVAKMVRDDIALKRLVWVLYHPGREGIGAINSG